MEDRELYEKRVGTTLRGTWTLERLLGVGGMAAVYVGVHTSGRREAIKILHAEIARVSELRARFEREARAVNQLDHPGVVAIRELSVTEDGEPFLVMELLDGEPLSDKAKREGDIAHSELLRLVDELLDVLAAAHAKGIIHRDIKLDNLFILQDGRLKVLDFGIAHMSSGDALALKTRMGAKLGTAPYMAPEQVKGLPIDERADLFAVGATMFRLIAKRRIHEAATEQEMFLLMATEPAPSLASVAPSAPSEVCLIVDRALAFHREKRYPDASTMQRDVRAARRGERPPYATARLAAGDPPNPSSTSGSGSTGAASAAPFADTPTVIHGNSMVTPGAAHADPPGSSLVSTADMTPLPPAPRAGAPVSKTSPMDAASDRRAPPRADPESTYGQPPPLAELRVALIAAAILFALAIVGVGAFWAWGGGKGETSPPLPPAPSAQQPH